MTIQDNYVGCDMGKGTIDVFEETRGTFLRVANEAAALAAFAAGLPRQCFVIFEATGGYDRLLRHALAEAGIAFARIDPARARHFAKLHGQHAKTDRLDARMLCRLGASLMPDRTPAPCPERERLVALARRRDQLVDMRARERRHREEAFHTDIEADIEAVIASLDGHIAGIEAEIDLLVRESGSLAEQAARLASAPGVGRVTALNLIAHMPELGTLSPKAAASLAGLAPLNNDSGKRHGRRSIRGGRPRVRKALYMAALSAIRANTRLRTFYTALAARCGSKKAAIIAVARKLLTILNAMERNKANFA
nr:IS110 family transposase [Mesorhizobium sp.]